MKVLSEEELKEKLAEKLADKNTADFNIISKKKVFHNGATDEIPNSEKEAEKSIKKYLLTTLARREYSAHELRHKLLQKEFDETLSEMVLQNLIEEGLQSDQRFCEMFIRSKISKSAGPFKIRMELQAKGIASALIDKAMSELECDWFALALEVAHKKVSSLKALDFNEKGKLMRFLQGRGFDQEQIRFAVDGLGLRGSSANEQL